MLVFKKTTQINKLKSHGGAKGLDGREKWLFCPYIKEDPDSYVWLEFGPRHIFIPST